MRKINHSSEFNNGAKIEQNIAKTKLADYIGKLSSTLKTTQRKTQDPD